MEFNNRLYELRKQKGLSQEELANRLNVTRQTVSKWEVGDSTPDMEKLVALSALFNVSMDELVMGKEAVTQDNPSKTDSDEKKTLIKKGLKVISIFAGIILAIDVISMIVYFAVYGVPK